MIETILVHGKHSARFDGTGLLDPTCDACKAKRVGDLDPNRCEVVTGIDWYRLRAIVREYPQLDALILTANAVEIQQIYHGGG